MSLIKTHKEVVVEKIILQYLLNKVIPTSDQIQKDLEEYEKQFNIRNATFLYCLYNQHRVNF